MHLQKAVDGYDVFARSLSIGAETMVMRVPARSADARAGTRSTTRSLVGRYRTMRCLTIGRLVNAFFRWEFNSCETLVKGAEVYPIDYANACPDVEL